MFDPIANPATRSCPLAGPNSTESALFGKQDSLIGQRMNDIWVERSPKFEALLGN